MESNRKLILVLGIVVLAGQVELTPSRRDADAASDLPDINADFIIEDRLESMEGDENMKKMLKELSNQIVMNSKQKDVEDIYNQIDRHFNLFATLSLVPSPDVPSDTVGDLCSMANTRIEVLNMLLDQMGSTVAPKLKMMPTLLDVMTEEITVSSNGLT